MSHIDCSNDEADRASPQTGDAIPNVIPFVGIFHKKPTPPHPDERAEPVAAQPSGEVAPGQSRSRKYRTRASGLAHLADAEPDADKMLVLLQQALTWVQLAENEELLIQGLEEKQR